MPDSPASGYLRTLRDNIQLMYEWVLQRMPLVAPATGGKKKKKGIVARTPKGTLALKQLDAWLQRLAAAEAPPPAGGASDASDTEEDIHAKEDEEEEDDAEVVDATGRVWGFGRGAGAGASAGGADINIDDEDDDEEMMRRVLAESERTALEESRRA
jgi:hypothetical protein